MTSATTLKLPQTLKIRIAAVAQQLDKTPHAFMVEALAAQTEHAERRRPFVVAAFDAEQDVAAHSLIHDADDVFAWLRAKVAGEATRRPRPRKRGKRA